MFEIYKIFVWLTLRLCVVDTFYNFSDKESFLTCNLLVLHSLVLMNLTVLVFSTTIFLNLSSENIIVTQPFVTRESEPWCQVSMNMIHCGKQTMLIIDFAKRVASHTLSKSEFYTYLGWEKGQCIHP